MAGLQDMAPTVEKRCVTRAVAAPIRAEAEAASQPAWPPPITMTSKLSRSVRMGGLLTHRQGSRKRKLERHLFHVKGCKADPRSFRENNPMHSRVALGNVVVFCERKRGHQGKRVVRRPRRGAIGPRRQAGRLGSPRPCERTDAIQAFLRTHS